MKIGLYSELARQHIVTIRDEIKQLGFNTNADEMTAYREVIRSSHKDHHQLISKTQDFYSLSSYRDLLFHVQEHRFTVPQIQSCLKTLSLTFSGFETTRFVQTFRESNPGDQDLYDLIKWHAYEEDNPQTFFSMYQFWCQKVHD